MSRLPLVTLLAMAATLNASGPYAPVRVSPRTESSSMQDESYNVGKALYSGAMKMGSGQSCSSCHTGPGALNRGRLTKLAARELPARIDHCVKDTARVNGAIPSTQLDALTHYLTKRFRL